MIITDQELQQFFSLLKEVSNYDLSEYSDKSLKRRIAKVLSDNRIDFPDLLTQLKNNPVFLEKTVKDITVNTTELFRDPQIWQNIKYKILPKYKNNKTINIWHAGCSTGQEVYSMMILLKEAGLLEKAKIYGTDINADVLQTAQKGIYKYRFNINYLDNFDKVIKQNPLNYDEYKDIPYSDYFTIDQDKDVIIMNKFLRDKAVYKKQDLVKDGNIFYTKFDIILCRNVIIYFNYELQNKVFKLLYDNLYPDGTLLLGVHETILGPMASKFEKNGLVYCKKEEYIEHFILS
ncbi:MAG: CheR family methyltransferase [Bacteroidota bacterium]|nr:CheR family methyltransferase [Bacteroidota bacterium]MDP4225635.1 CheR family methyltransferase [Bacteroidota bacterium]MDP4272755.1 CheR family methyltransferase [Bacteroidota bacterium]